MREREIPLYDTRDSHAPRLLRLTTETRSVFRRHVRPGGPQRLGIDSLLRGKVVARLQRRLCKRPAVTEMFRQVLQFLHAGRLRPMVKEVLQIDGIDQKGGRPGRLSVDAPRHRRDEFLRRREIELLQGRGNRRAKGMNARRVFQGY